MSTNKKALVTHLIDIVEDLEMYEAELHKAAIKNSGIEKIIMMGIELLGLLNRHDEIQPVEEDAVEAYELSSALFYDKIKGFINYQLSKTRYEKPNMSRLQPTNAVGQRTRFVGV